MAALYNMLVTSSLASQLVLPEWLLQQLKAMPAATPVAVRSVQCRQSTTCGPRQIHLPRPDFCQWQVLRHLQQGL
jgi:hypothetical protein